MRLLRYGPLGAERPAALLSRSADAAEVAYDISSLTVDIDGDFLSGGGVERVAAAIAEQRLPIVDLAGHRIGAPIARPGSIYAIGLNYRDHAVEAGFELPTEPIVFTKAPNTLVGPQDTILIPPGATKLDWEVEVGIVIGKPAVYLPDVAAAEQVIAGYVAVNDVSERAWQLERGGQWLKGKSFPTSNPLGPWLATPDEINVTDTRLSLRVNGETKQSANTSDMIFSPAYIVWYLSQFLALEPGDLIDTGTPDGVGGATGTFLHAGDLIEIEIDGLGSLRNRVSHVDSETLSSTEEGM